MASPAAANLRATLNPGKDRIRVVIADETPLGCELLKQVLGSHPCIHVVGTIFSAQELLAKINEAATELLLINVDLYEGHLSGLSVVSELHASLPNLPIVVICDRACDDLVLKVIPCWRPRLSMSIRFTWATLQMHSGGSPGPDLGQQRSTSSIAGDAGPGAICSHSQRERAQSLG